jgi:hypothetical protein
MGDLLTSIFVAIPERFSVSAKFIQKEIKRARRISSKRRRGICLDLWKE